ncbi:class I SAM-dependent methyltransferase [Epilithonimonas sp. UC225_85]|uniref:class I SAM-dependent methyltransferase n=1 Tax=Epilithonimonas sp. UC225_85 TaxID=3350167 RepID=UPI0036D32FFF
MEPNNKDSSKIWSEVANLYEEKFLNLNIYDETYDLFCNEIKNSVPAILDIGCGPGNISKYILNKIENADILGIDYSEKMIQLAKKNVPKARFEEMDCREINQINKKFDAVISGFFLPYLNKKETDIFFSNVKSLLKDNGVAYFSFVEGNPEDSDYQTSSSGQRLFFNFHLIEDIKQKLTRLGFNDFQIMKINYQRNETETEVHTVIITNI